MYPLKTILEQLIYFSPLYLVVLHGGGVDVSVSRRTTPPTLYDGSSPPSSGPNHEYEVPVRSLLQGEGSVESLSNRSGSRRVHSSPT